MYMSHPELSKILENIFNDVSALFNSLSGFDENNLQIILVSYRKTSDSVVFWDLFKKNDQKEKVLSRINIRNGDGTVGYIVRSKKPEMIGDTFDDPRGSVAIEDFFIGNKSFFGIPVSDNTGELKFIISFSYNQVNIWRKSSNNDIIDKIKTLIEEKYQKELLLLNEIQSLTKIQDVLIGDNSQDFSLLNRMMRIINETVDYTFLVHSQNGLIRQVKINDSLIANRIFSFLNWCFLFETRCSDCPIDNPNCKNNYCKYYSNFLKYLPDFAVIELPLDNNNHIVLKLYCLKKDDSEKLIQNDKFKECFAPIISLFNQEGLSNVQKKILVEVISRIISLYTTGLISNDESEIDNTDFGKYVEIIKHYFDHELVLELDKIKNTFEGLLQLKERILLIELWQNNITGIRISKITKNNTEEYSDVNSSLLLDSDFRETATVKVIVNPNFIFDDKNKNNLDYEPLITANDNESIHKTSNKYVIRKGSDQYEIEWNDINNLRQLIRVQINSRFLEQYLKNNYSTTQLIKKFKENEFIKHHCTESFQNNKTVNNLEIILALNNNLTAREKDPIVKFADNVFQIELKEIADTHSIIADIINRNYAHHIGSHVSNRATFERILQKLDIKIDGIVKNQLASIASMRSTLEKYKDERSEFIASITSSQVSQSFMFYNDIIRPFVENTLLIDNIAANEGIGYFKKDQNGFSRNGVQNYLEETLSQLVIRVFIHKNFNISEKENTTYRTDLTPIPTDFFEQKIVYTCKWDANGSTLSFDSLSIPYFLIKTNLEDQFYEKLELQNPDIEVSLPGGLGKHLLYSILENYIRNSAKHAYKAIHKDKPVEIIFKLMPDENSVDKIVLEITRSLEEETNDAAKGLCVNLNKKIQAKLSERQGMGIADMKICACLMADQVLTDENLSGSIKAITTDKAVGYQMKLSLPKKVALINCLKEKEKKNGGIYYFTTIDEFIAYNNFNFQFAILKVEKDFNTVIKGYNHVLPLKLIVLNDRTEEKQISTQSSDRYYTVESVNLIKTDAEKEETLLEWCWKNWVTHKTKGNSSKLSIYFEQTKKEPNAEAWGALDNFKNGQPFSLNVVTHDDSKNIEYKPVLTNSNVLFDRHGKLINEFSSGKFIDQNFWELFDKNNPDTNIIFSADTKQQPFLLPFEMMSAALSRVLIIDERVAEVSQNKIEGAPFIKLVKHNGFNYCKNHYYEPSIFDACWAAGIHIATSLSYNGTERMVSSNLKSDSLADHHYLEIKFDCNEGSNIEISSKTNLDNSVGNCSMKDMDIKYDCIVIHRTILKETIDAFKCNDFLNNIMPKLFVVTGGGVVDFLDSVKYKPRILTTNILKDNLLSGRIAKLSLINNLN